MSKSTCLEFPSFWLWVSILSLSHTGTAGNKSGELSSPLLEISVSKPVCSLRVQGKFRVKVLQCSVCLSPVLPLPSLAMGSMVPPRKEPLHSPCRELPISNGTRSGPLTQGSPTRYFCHLKSLFSPFRGFLLLFFLEQLIGKGICILIFIASLFTVAKTWKQHKCL